MKTQEQRKDDNRAEMMDRKARRSNRRRNLAVIPNNERTHAYGAPVLRTGKVYDRRGKR